MATIDELMPYTRPSWELDRRLTYHVGSGEMLSGLTYVNTLQAEEEGAGDLPSLRLQRIRMTTEHAPGANTGDYRSGNTRVWMVLRITYRLTNHTDAGMVRTDPHDSSQDKGLMEWQALVMDAFETDTSGRVDTQLHRSAGAPMLVEITGDGATQLGMWTDLEVSIRLPDMDRGTRSVLGSA